ncbi:MAG TPA: hypothetical protein VEW03_12720, partial [Longimicrobiaceae bacterium]|nr:hypothetical protein [Longimicrobiaceae bacterium]
AKVGKHPFYQSIALLAPERLPGQGGAGAVLRVWMVGLRNTEQGSSNFVKGENRADLFELTFPEASLGAWGPAARVEVRRKGEHTFKFGRRDGNFSAGGGVDVEPDGRIAVYAAHHWRDERGVPLSFSRSGA